MCSMRSPRSSISWISHGSPDSPASALDLPQNGVLTRETAQRYFGDWKNAMGRIILFKNRDAFTVSGIVEEYPVNSDFPFKVLLSIASIKNRGKGHVQGLGRCVWDVQLLCATPAGSPYDRTRCVPGFSRQSTQASRVSQRPSRVSAPGRCAF